MDTRAETAFEPANAMRALLCAVPLLLATGLETPADAGPNLIVDGTFSALSAGQTLNATNSGIFLCANGNGVGNTCTSHLADWSGTCSGHGCTGTNSPSSILYEDATHGVYFNKWNGGNGLAGSLAAPPSGGNVVALDGDTQYTSTLFQTITGLTAGDRFQLTFYEAAAQQSGSSGITTDMAKVTFGSSVQYGPLLTDQSQSVVPWAVVTLDFIATSTSEVLTFLDIGTPGNQPPVLLLAGLSLTDIPEPASLVLFCGGLVGLFAVRRRTRA